MTTSTIYPPDPRSLLPPLLACLPTSAFCARAPPALPPLITPILRQRLNIFEKSPQAGSWLRLLNWNSDQASKLSSIVETMNLEAHPISGEPEIRDISGIQYKRYDSETLHARLQVDEFDLQPIYLWCMIGGETGPAWLLTELKPLEDQDESDTWFTSVSDAEQSFEQSQSQSQIKQVALPDISAAEDDDSAYWAAYDNDPGRTPGISAKPSPAPAQQRPNGVAAQYPSKADEAEYFARYASEVQPLMDPYDADEDNGALPESTLNQHQRDYSAPTDGHPITSTTIAHYGHDHHQHQHHLNESPHTHLSTPPHNPQPRSSASSSPRSIRALEAEAERQSLAEVGIKQHISTEFKSLFRLARSAGIGRDEFERIVQRELAVLPLLDAE